MAYISRIYEAIDMLSEFFEQKGPKLGIQYVGKYEEKRIPKYPAVIIIPGARDKEIHGTNTFQIVLVAHIFVYHAQLTLRKRERSKADLKLVADIEQEMESDYTWKSDPLVPTSARVIFGYIAGERPGFIQPNVNKTDVVIGTRMEWRGLTQRRFDFSES